MTMNIQSWRNNMTSEQLYQDTLEMVNKIRIIRGQEPLNELRPGDLGDPKSCPIQQSLECLYAGHDYIKWNDNDGADTPNILSQFMTEFDHEIFPELIVEYDDE